MKRIRKLSLNKLNGIKPAASVVVFAALSMLSFVGGKIFASKRIAGRSARDAQRILLPAYSAAAKRIAPTTDVASKHISREGMRLLILSRHRAKEFKMTRKMKVGLSLCGVLAVCFFVLSTVLIGSEMMAVTVNGQVVGYVSDENEYALLVQNAKEKISRTTGNSDLIVQDEQVMLAPKFVPGNPPADTLIDEDQLIDKLLEEDAVKTNIYTLNVGGEEIAQFGTLGDAADALKGIESEFGGADPLTEGVFKEDIAIESRTAGLKEATALDPPEVVKDKLLTGGDDLTYTVQEGDTLDLILAVTGLPAEDLADKNPDVDFKALVPGTALLLAKAEPLIHYETTGIEVVIEQTDYPTTEERTDTLYIGVREVKTPGVPGEIRVTRNVTRVNGEIVFSEDISSEHVKDPEAEVILVGTNFRELEGAGSGPLGRPLESWILTRSIGNGHMGADMIAPQGSPVYAAEGGTIIFSGMYGAYGNLVKIDHGGGLQTWYAHNELNGVAEGDIVTRGQQIATVGITGRATAYHVHFEVRVNGEAQEPMAWIE